MFISLKPRIKIDFFAIRTDLVDSELEGIIPSSHGSPSNYI
jgi:hypothetical protein